jgi:hypothetical protein
MGASIFFIQMAGRLVGVSPTVLDEHTGGQRLTASGPSTLIGGPNDILSGGPGAGTFVF